MAAVGATDWSYWLILWTITGVTQGFGVFVSRYFGKQEYDKMNRSITMSTILCAIIGVILTLAGVLAAKPLLILLETPADILDGAVTYLTTMVAGTLVVIAGSGMIMQSTINQHGSLFVAGYTASNKLYGLLESSAISLGFAFSTFFAQNYGAGNKQRVRSGENFF